MITTVVPGADPSARRAWRRAFPGPPGSLPRGGDGGGLVRRHRVRDQPGHVVGAGLVAVQGAESEARAAVAPGEQVEAGVDDSGLLNVPGADVIPGKSCGIAPRGLLLLGWIQHPNPFENRAVFHVGAPMAHRGSIGYWLSLAIAKPVNSPQGRRSVGPECKGSEVLSSTSNRIEANEQASREGSRRLPTEFSGWAAPAQASPGVPHLRREGPDTAPHLHGPGPATGTGRLPPAPPRSMNCLIASLRLLTWPPGAHQDGSQFTDTGPGAHGCPLPQYFG